MITTQPIQDIAAQPIFSVLSEEQIHRLLISSRNLKLTKHQTLFKMGDEAQSFYLLTKGQVKISRNSINGMEKILEIVRPGHLFAEAVMFLPEPRYPANCTALTKSNVISFSNQQFLKLLHDNPDLSLKLLGRLSHRLHNFVNEIDSLALQNAYLRVVNYLNAQLPELNGREVSIELEAPKQTIASFISVTPETFSRTLKQLEDEKILRIKRNTIHIPDIDKLKARAHNNHI